MAGETVVEAVQAEGAGSGDEMPFTIFTLLGDVRELGDFGEDQAVLLGLIE